MLRILKAPVRVPIPDAPTSQVLEQYRDAQCERVRMRCVALLAHRANKLTPRDGEALRAAEARIAALAKSAQSHPIERLATAAGAGSGGVEVLSIVVAPFLDPTVRKAYSELQSDLHLGIDLETVRDLISDQVANGSVTDWLGLGGLFEQLGLVEVTRTSTGRQLVQATARLRGLCEGELVSDPRLATIAHWRECTRDDATGVLTSGELDQLVDVMQSVIASCTPPLLFLVGPSGAGRTRVAQAVAARVGLRWIAVIDAALLPRDARDAAALLDLCARDVRFLQGLFVVRGIDALEPQRRNIFASVLTRMTIPVAVTSESEDIGELEKFVAMRQVVRRPSADLREAAWKVELIGRDATLTEEEISRVAAGYPLTRSSIARAVELAAARSRSLTSVEVEAAAASQVRSHLERFAKRIVPRTRLTDLVLADDVREQVDELLQAVRVRPELRRAMRGHFIGPAGIAALFNGPPGTGKTLTASALANELALPMYKIDVSSIVDRYVGETEKNLSRIFEEAESERGLLLFDEADSLFTKRVEVSDSHDRYANMQVNMLLNLIDEYSGFVILTTNLKASIDTAFLRRLSFKVSFELPEPPEREALWRMHMPAEVAVAKDVSPEKLAEQFKASGGEIRNAVYRALLMTPLGAPLDAARLQRAMALELEASGNVVRR